MPLAAVSGSASGIGAAAVAVLRSAGYDIIGIDLHDADVIADLSAEEGRERAVREVLEIGGGALDRLVLCAGLGPQFDPVEKIVEVNYFGAVALLDGVLPALSKGTDPAAVVVSSVSSSQLTWQDNPIAGPVSEGDRAAIAQVLAGAGEVRGQVAYAGSKNALTVAVRKRAVEWGAAGVRLNTVAPGSVETPLLQAGLDDPLYGPAIRDFQAPVPRRARPEEVAELISYLLGLEAGFIHGAQFTIDGGVDASMRPTAF